MNDPQGGKDTSFSAGWVAVTSLAPMLVLALICFALGGFIIGKKSPGQTILEAGLAAAAAVIITQLVKVALLNAPLELASLVIGSAIPFGAGLFGGWLGEKAQDDA
jgi:uncharacterized membrane protein YiaA